VRTAGLYWRFLFVELVKLIALSAAVVVVVGAFGLVIKPLAEGRLAPLDALRFMLYASVPMLQYALPFAAGFAATLVYHRAGQDNEVTACFAGGVSHRALLGPALVIGLVMAGLMFVLTDQAMPRLLRRMQELITADAARMVASAVDKGEPLVIDSRRSVYARAFARPESAPPPPAIDHFVLSGVLAVETDAAGAVTKEAAAELAYVWLYRGAGGGADAGEDVTTVVMKLRNTSGGITGRGQFELEQAPYVFRVPETLTDDPKYLTWAEMDAAYDHPERMSPVEQRRWRLVLRLAERQSAAKVREDLMRGGVMTLTDAAGRPVVIRAAGLAASAGRVEGSGDGFELAAGPDGVIEVRAMLEDGRTRTHRAERAWLSQSATPAPGGGGMLGASGNASASQLVLRMENVSTTGPGLTAEAVGGGAADQTPGVLKDYSIAGLTPTPDPLPTLAGLSVERLLAEARGYAVQDQPLVDARRALDRRTEALRREIRAKQHERIAAALACIVTILCGAVMALRLREALPLPVYLWSFLPSLLGIFAISGGQSVAQAQGQWGVPMVYAGVVGLGVWTFVQYRVLARR
jgi:lipopolysaccharide export LptBFGC system permease protein LptF